jgi:aldose sugar dehydrogenase
MPLSRWMVPAAVLATVWLGGTGQISNAQVADAGAPAPPQAPQGGRGGRGGAGAMLFTEHCASCHGTGAGPARAVNVLDEAWLSKRDDESLAKAIRDGVPGTDMTSLADKLDAQQIWQLVYYLRTRAAEIKGRPEYVPDPDGQVIKSEKQTFKVEVIARELETPWGLAFLPDGRLLVSERPGRLRVIEKGKLLPEPVKGTPKVWERQDGGMFDVEVHPQYAKNGWIYLSYSETVPNYTPPPPAPAPDPAAATAAAQPGRGRGNQPPSIPSMTVIVRGKIKNNEWVEEQVLYRAAPELYTTNNSHYGSRFIFDRDGHLFYTLGERGVMADAQDLAKATGKIHRVNDDGSVPKDNPFTGKAGVVPTIWTYGNRNPQGLAWDPVTGQLWESEHGPQGGDEINILQPGRNYGWGVITHGLQPGITSRTQPGMESPIVYYTPTIAPSGIAFYTGTRYPGWRNNLFVTGLAGQQLRRLEVAAGKVTAQEIVFNQFGRVHDVVQGPDGLFYIALQLPGQSLSQSTPGTVIRLVPVQ